MLESGKVELAHEKIQSFSYTMQPGEKATYNITDKALTLIMRMLPYTHPGKMENLSSATNCSMKNVVEKFKRWYNINIEVTDAEVYSSIFSGTIQNESYEEIFRYIEIVCDVDCRLIHNYEKEAKPEIIISKK